MGVLGRSRQVARFGGFEFHFRTVELGCRGHRVKLQGQPLQLLALLLERPGEVVTREEMRTRLWPEGTFVDFEHSLNTAIKKLRQALRDSATKPRFVETLARQGYRFIATIDISDEPSAPLPQRRLSEGNGSSTSEDTAASRGLLLRDAVGPWPTKKLTAKTALLWLVALAAKRLPVPIRRRIGWSVVIGAFILLAAMTLFTVRSRSRGRPSRGWSLTLLVPAESDPSDPAISPDGKMVAYVAKRDGIARIFVRRVAGGREIPLTPKRTREAEPAFSPDSERVAFTRFSAPRGRPQICIMPVPGGEMVPVVEGGRDPAWSMDGTRLAFVFQKPGEPETLAISRSDGSGIRILLLGDGAYPFLHYPAWSPDGRWIAVERSMGGVSGEVWLVPSQGGAPRRLQEANPGVFCHHPLFTPDGQSVIYSSNRSGATSLWSQSLKDGAAVQLTQGPGPDEWPSVTRGGSVAFLNSHSKDELFVRNLKTGATVCLLRHAPFLWAPSFSPDGQEIAFSRAEHNGLWQIWLVPVGGGDPRPLTSGQEPQIYGRFSSDGQWIIYFTWAPASSRIWRVPRRGGSPKPLTPSYENDAYGDLSPDGRLLAFARIKKQGPRLCVMPVGGGPERQLTGSSATVPRWSPDGRWLVFSPDRGYDGGVFIIHPDGSRIRRLTSSGGWPVWFPDSKRIAFRTIRPDGTQQINTVRPDGGKVVPLRGIQFFGDNDPFDFSRDGSFMTYTNEAAFSSEIWLLQPRP